MRVQGQSLMKTIKVQDSLHEQIKLYCIFHKEKIETFIGEELHKSRKLKKFIKQIKTKKLI